MDEMTQLRDFRSEVVGTGPGPMPPFVQGSGRARRPRRPSRRWALAGLGVTAAAVAGVLVAQAGPGASPSAAEVLDRAAATVAAAPGVRPRDDQWVYETDVQGDGPQHVGEGWSRFDGTRYAENQPTDSTHLVVQVLPPHQKVPSPEEWYDGLASLPDDPAALLAQLRTGDLVHGRGRTRAARDFDAVTQCLEQAPVLSPQAHARLFRALATIPGVGIDEHPRPDVLGRRVLAVTWTGQTQPGFSALNKRELLLDPASYAYRGLRVTALEDFTFPDGRDSARKGETWYDSAMPASGIVDEPGQRP